MHAVVYGVEQNQYGALPGLVIGCSRELQSVAQGTGHF